MPSIVSDYEAALCFLDFFRIIFIIHKHSTYVIPLFTYVSFYHQFQGNKFDIRVNTCCDKTIEYFFFTRTLFLSHVRDCDFNTRLE